MELRWAVGRSEEAAVLKANEIYIYMYILFLFSLLFYIIYYFIS